jgi:hypothetical protein
VDVAVVTYPDHSGPSALGPKLCLWFLIVLLVVTALRGCTANRQIPPPPTPIQKDGDEMGARCWRIALVDIEQEAVRAMLAKIEGDTK